MVACLKHVAHTGKEAVNVWLQELSLLRPEEALHGRAGQVKRSVAVAVDALPRLILGRSRGPRRLGHQQRPAAAIGWVTLCLAVQPLASAGQVEGDQP